MREANTKIKGAIRLDDNNKGPLMSQRFCTAKLHMPKRIGLRAETLPKERRHCFTVERLKILGQSDLAGCKTFPTIALSDYAERMIGNA